MLVRAILAFFALPVTVAGLVPWMISMIPAADAWRSPCGFVLIALGISVHLPSVISFYRHGRGTLAPWDPPRQLVIQDLYRFNRNPMYIGVTSVLFGWALVTGNPWNHAYAAIMLMIFHLRVVFYEEREMARLFGSDWDAYRRAVPRWGLRFRCYNPRMASRERQVKERQSGEEKTYGHS